MPEISQDVLDGVEQALRKAEVTFLALSDANPYKDDPRWSPWTRWQKPAAERCRAARIALGRDADPEKP